MKLKVQVKLRKGDDRRMGLKFGLGLGPTGNLSKGPLANQMTIFNVHSHTQQPTVTIEDMRSFIRPKHLTDMFKDTIFSEDVKTVNRGSKSLAKRLRPQDIHLDGQKVI